MEMHHTQLRPLPHTNSRDTPQNLAETILGTSRSKMQQSMQIAQGQVLVRICALVQSAIGCCSLLLLVPKMVLTLCNLRWWWCSSHQLAQIHNLHLWWSLSATCTGGIYIYIYICMHIYNFHIILCIHNNGNVSI